MANKKKIIIIGDINGQNVYHVGDEAILSANLMLLRKVLKNIEIVVCSRSPEVTSETHNIKAVKSLEKYLKEQDNLIKGLIKTVIFTLFSPKKIKFLDELKKSDLTLICGGGNLNSLFRKTFYLRCIQVAIAGLFKKKIFVSGQTIGPFYNKLDKWVAGRMLNITSVVGIRDKSASKMLLKEMKVVRPVIYEEIDDAFYLPSQKINLKVLTDNFRKENEILFGVALCWRRKMRDDILNINITNLLNYLLKRFNILIVFIPHVRRDKVKDDIDISRTIQSKIIFPRRSIVLDHPYSDKEIKFITGKMDFNLTMRYHGLVFSIETATPFAALSYDTYSYNKMKGIYDFIEPGLEETHIHTIKKKDQHILNRKVAHLFENRKTLFENMPNFLEKDNDQHPRKTMMLRELIHDT